MSMLKKVFGLFGQNGRDAQAITEGRGEQVAKRRGRQVATKHAPGGATGRRIVGKLFK
ncbi:MAG: hypothetical protein M0R75_13055 [Dehalococcoidia bacterium]|jgi:hypothetical protein|nr:hypothetical protein [Dehalococcoidia bacterium]